jgi:hypothetical protein
MRDGPRTPKRFHHLPQHQHVTLLVFLFAKRGPHHLARGVVNASDQCEAWASFL